MMLLLLFYFYFRFGHTWIIKNVKDLKTRVVEVAHLYITSYHFFFFF